VLAEYQRTLSSPKFAFTQARIRTVLQQLQKHAHSIEPVRTLSECRHEEDNRFLECADAAGAEFLITGNKRHFPAQWKQTMIVNARHFLELTFPRINK
jgi:putative PIN family toxin of toxin-antitoxin system